jgi:hypothetical protein
MLMRRVVIALVFLVGACTATTSVTRTGTGLFAPRENNADEEEDAPRGLTLSVQSIARDGTVILDLRNYSMEPFVFSGTEDRARLMIEVQSGSTHSRHTISPSIRLKRRELPTGDRVQLKANITGASGSVRIGIRSEEFGFIVWTDWIGR